ncbi:MAG: hypothetical protein II548_03830 [Bacteroidales bacterium]|nr:hypothetical protein [Bacteroidales bacterium]
MMPRGDKLILAPPPEYAVSGGWALRGATSQGALLAPCQRHDGIPGQAGNDEGHGDDGKGGFPDRSGMAAGGDARTGRA